MRCLRCGNEDDKYFYNDRGIIYCRKCVHFNRLNINELPKKINYTATKHHISTKLDYPLTKNQKLISDGLIKSKAKENLVYAACGAGKTEIVMKIIEKYLNEGKKVGFAISRRQVVLEIRERLAKAFYPLKVIAVCEGYTKITDGDIIVCTMHQLYRYYDTFDLLIMDEIDAFPYANDEMLEYIAMSASVGKIIYLTATPSDKLLDRVKQKEVKMFELFTRPHGFRLIEPTVLIRPSFIKYLTLYKIIKSSLNQLMVYVPTIDETKNIYYIFKYLCKCNYITSKTIDSEKVINSFKNKEFNILFTTTLMERGVTIDGIDICVFKSDHLIFSEANLIQMSGRVGRKINHPDGNAYFICDKQSQAMKKSISSIKKMNEDFNE